MQALSGPGEIVLPDKSLFSNTPRLSSPGLFLPPDRGCACVYVWTTGSMQPTQCLSGLIRESSPKVVSGMKHSVSLGTSYLLSRM